MTEPPEAVLAAARGELPANVALAQMIASADSRATLECALAYAMRRFGHDADARERLAAIRRLWHETPEAWDLVRGVLHEVPHDRQAPTTADWADCFDRAAARSPRAAAAAYSLGRPDLLGLAAAEVVARLSAWGLLRPGSRILDLGCGEGRMLRALAPVAAAVVGTDVSAAMLAAARESCISLGNVRIVDSDGRSLASFADDAFDLVVAVDVFPYIVRSGLAATMLREARRVLQADGSLLVINYDYGCDPRHEAAEVAAAAHASGLGLARSAAGGYAYWDGRTYEIRRRE